VNGFCFSFCFLLFQIMEDQKKKETVETGHGRESGQSE
jgi:hypothetical protein